MDREDLIYMLAVTLVAIGAGLFHVGAGFVCAGLGMAFPFVLSILRSHPPKGKP